jgi:hypothetical protein
MWEEVPSRKNMPQWPVQAQQVPSRQDQVQQKMCGKLQPLMACERNDTHNTPGNLQQQAFITAHGSTWQLRRTVLHHITGTTVMAKD